MSTPPTSANPAELDAYLAELDAEFGPVPAAEADAARAWADRVLPAAVPVATSSSAARRA